MVAQLLRGGGEVALEQIGDGGFAADGGFFGEDGGFVDLLVVEAGDFLGFLVFEDLEIGGFESFDELAGFFIADDDVVEDDVGFGDVGVGGSAGLLRGVVLAGSLLRRDACLRVDDGAEQ